MRTQGIQIILVGLVLFTGSLGCGKKLCQPNLPAVPQSLTEQEWALRSVVGEPLNINNQNYVIWKFNPTFDGVLKTIKNNATISEKPFNYAVTSEGKVCIDYDARTSKETLRTICQSGSGLNNQTSAGATVHHYSYQFDKSKKGTLYLSDSNSTYTTSYFTGAINTDNFCQF